MSPWSEALDFLVELLDLEPIEVNIFRGVSPDERRQRMFGGQVAAQALMAAGRTVERGRVHSLHSYFLRPGDPTVPILYEVDRIRDGRSFTTRQCRGDPARPCDLQPGDLVPRRRSWCVRPSVPDARCAGPRAAAAPCSNASNPFGTSSPIGSPALIPSINVTSASCRGCSTSPDPVQRLWIRADGDLRDDPSAPRLYRAHTRPTCRCSTRCSRLTWCNGKTLRSWGQASTIACGSTGHSGPTGGCSTTWTARTPRSARTCSRLPLHP